MNHRATPPAQPEPGALLDTQAPGSAASAPRQATPAGKLDEGPLRGVLGYQLAQASVVTDQVFEAHIVQPHELRKVEYTVLALVERNPGLTAAQLASALAFTQANVSSWLDRLERRGLVEREQHARDRRAQHIRATSAGLELASKATQAICQAEEKALSKLSQAEWLMLIELLHKAAGCRVSR